MSVPALSVKYSAAKSLHGHLTRGGAGYRHHYRNVVLVDSHCCVPSVGRP